MKFLALAASAAQIAACWAKVSPHGPQNIDEVVELAFPSDAPKFTAVPLSEGHLAVTGNDTAILKVHSIKFAPYPLRPGLVEFNIEHSLVDTLPKDTQLHLHAWVNGQQAFDGTVPLCDYLLYAKMDCPIAAHPVETITKKLQIPDNIATNVVTFVARAFVPGSDKLVAHLAGLIELQDGNHDEL